MPRVGGNQARKQIEGSLRPYIFLSQHWLPALVSSEFSYSILHLASSVHSFTLYCITPEDHAAEHPFNPEHPVCGRILLKAWSTWARDAQVL